MALDICICYTLVYFNSILVGVYWYGNGNGHLKTCVTLNFQKVTNKPNLDRTNKYKLQQKL